MGIAVQVSRGRPRDHRPARPVRLHYSADDLYAATLIGLLGAAEAGISTVVDWCEVNTDDAHTDAALQLRRLRATDRVRFRRLGRRSRWMAERAATAGCDPGSPNVTFAAGPSAVGRGPRELDRGPSSGSASTPTPGRPIRRKAWLAMTCSGRMSPWSTARTSQTTTSTHRLDQTAMVLTPAANWHGVSPR